MSSSSSAAAYQPVGSRARLAWASRPRHGFEDLAAQLWRQRLMMLLIFAVLVALGVLVAFMLPKTFTARSDLLVQLSQDYVYQPRAGDAARGAIPEVTDVVQAEAAIISSGALHERVVAAIGPDIVLGDDAEGTPQERQAAAIVAIGRNLSVGTSPDTGVVTLSYKSDSAEAAARILNQIVQSYLVYRREVFRDNTGPLLAEQRNEIERQLNSADSAYDSFLTDHNLGDFTNERTAVQNAYQTAFNERLTVESALHQADSRLAALNRQMGNIPPEVTLQQDLNLSAQERLQTLRADRETLLGRYQADAQPVRDIDAQIAQIEAFANGPQGVGILAQREGPNTVWQDIRTDQIRAQAERDALAAQFRTLSQQLDQLNQRQVQLAQLESQNGALTAERDVLTTAYRDFTTRQTEARSSSELARGGADSIRVIAPAITPDKPSSLRKPVFALALVFALFTALCAGLLRIFMGRRFVTPGSAARTLDLPVLAVAPAKAR